jgi:outer membrane protein
MKTRFLAPSIAAMTAALAVASSAVAQAPAAAPPPLAQGPVIPGVCILSVQQAISQSTVGQYVNQRMGQIVSQVQAELDPEKTAIATDARALEAARGTLDQATLQSKGAALQARYTAYNEKAQLRQKEIQATEQKSYNRIAQELDPIAKQLYQAKKCSLLVDKGSVLIASPDYDISLQAIAALNTRIQQFPFDREHLDTAVAPAR